MILPFSTKFPNGKPTYFIEKIWTSISAIYPELSNQYIRHFFPQHRMKFGCDWDETNHPRVAKKHTIRKDERNRWKPGMKIHFVINNRTKNFFQFAPVIECKSVQKIEIKDVSDLEVRERNFLQRVYVESLKETFYKAWRVEVDGRKLTIPEVWKLAKNDGFESVDEFFNWFNSDFTGKIIHWTDLKY